MKSPVLALVTCIVAAVSPGAALADVVSDPPKTCPSGATPDTCHAGPFCAPSECTADTDCTGGATCVEQSLCVREIVCAGLIEPDASLDPYKRKDVLSACPSDTCDAPAACTSLKVCAPSGGGASSSDSATDTGCGCVAAGAREGSIAGLLLLGAAAAIVAGRASRRRKG
jgi:hypothetical protein